MKATISLFLLILITSTLVRAQDIHWSQFNDIPLFQNPGHAGNFDGDYRFVGNYRNQWRSVTVPFSTFSLSADTRLYNNKNIGLGMLFFHDVDGDGKLRTTEFQGNASFLIKATSDSVHTLRPGINIGLNHRQVNWDAFYFDNQFNGVNFDPSLPTMENFQTDRKTNLSVGAGIVHEYFLDKRKKLVSGIGFYNLNRPNQGFYSTVIQRDIRFNFFTRASYKLDVDWDILPSINLSLQGKYRELILGSQVKYYLVNTAKSYRALYGGLWLRNKDAAYISLGMDYQDWFVGISYDVNFSKLIPASNLRGGYEIAVRYILNHFKPKKIQHRVCPDFI